MPYKLYYFDIKGIAEPIRLLLSYGNIEFKDIRIADDDWPAMKSTMPMEAMPVLEFEDKRIHQSVAISRFLAKKVGLAGKSDMENFEIDSVVDTLSDFMNKIASAHYEEDEKSKEIKMKKMLAETVPFYIEKLEEIAKENDGHLAMKRLTWADIFLTGIIGYLNYATKQDLTANQPNLKKVVDGTSSVEGIKEWIAKRPKSEM